MTALTPRYTPREELANSLSHGLGIVLAIGGLAVLSAVSAREGSAWHVVSSAVFGTTLILAYTTSTLYHSIPAPKAKTVLRALDHSAIYLLIAGTYTPFALVSLRGPWGWTLFGLVWGFAVLGIVVRNFFGRGSSKLAVAIYVGMGWIMLIAIKPLFAAVELGGIFLLTLGGITYTAGAPFYLWRKLPYNHAIWHGFVLLGSTLHYFAVLFYVVPWPPS